MVNLAEAWSYLDLGDIEGKSFEDIVSSVEGRISSIYRGQKFLFLGGDHSITYATFRGLRKASGQEFGLVYFDAHPDCYEIYDGNPYSHACTVRRLVEEGYVKDVVMIGIRAATRQQMEFAREKGMKIFSVD